MSRKKPQTPPSNIDANGKIIDLMVALKQCLAGQPVTGIPEKAPLANSHVVVPDTAEGKP